MRKSILFGFILFLGLLTEVSAQSGGTYQMQRSVIAGGGTHSTAGAYIVDGTIGQPLAGVQSSGGTFNVASGFWSAGGPNAVLNLRGDVAPRNSGDGNLQSNDVVQVQRFQIGLDAIIPGSNEFLRADTAPVATNGDGFIQSDDVIQTQRYQIGLDAKQTFLGRPENDVSIPWTIASSDEPGVTKEHRKDRSMRVEYAGESSYGTLTVDILVDANGDESAYGFTLGYDPDRLASPSTAKGTSGGSSVCNAAARGQITCSINNFPDDRVGTSTDQIGEIHAGTGQALVRITFKIVGEEPSRAGSLTLTNVNASDDAARGLQLMTQNGGLSGIWRGRKATVDAIGAVQSHY